MSEYAVMPMQDYIKACESVREKTLSQNTIKSAELSAEILNVYEMGKEDFGNKRSVKGENSVTAEYVKNHPHSVPVKLSSKEFIPFPYYGTDFNNGAVTLKVNPDGSVTVNGTGFIQWCFTNPNDAGRPILPAGSYSLSGIPENLNDFRISLQAVEDANQMTSFSVNSNFTIDTEHYMRVMINATVTPKTYDNLTFRPSLKRADIENVLLTRYGQTESDSPQAYTVNQDGTVDGVTSLSPTMNLVTDAEGVIIEAEYYEDIKAEQGRFWAVYQGKGQRVDYTNAFEGEYWNNENFRPIYDIVPTICYRMFAESGISGDLTQILKDSGVVLDTSNATDMYYSFAYSNFTRIGEISFESVRNLNQAFRSAQKLETIDLIKLREDGANTFSNAFYGCSALKNITFSGVIGENISLSNSPLLSAQSIRNIVEHLSDKATSKTLTLSQITVNNAFSSEEWQTLTATKPNWKFTLI